MKQFFSEQPLDFSIENGLMIIGFVAIICLICYLMPTPKEPEYRRVKK